MISALTVREGSGKAIKLISILLLSHTIHSTIRFQVDAFHSFNDIHAFQMKNVKESATTLSALSSDNDNSFIPMETYKRLK